MKKNTKKSPAKKTKRTIAYVAVTETNPTVDDITDGTVVWATTKAKALTDLATLYPNAKPKKVVRAIFTTFSV